MTSNDWRELPLADICEYISRGVTPAYTDQDGVIVLNQKCIRDNRISYEQSRLTNPLKKKISVEKYLRKYDILINSTGVGTLGRVAQIKEIPGNTTVDSHVTIVRAKENVNACFLGYNLFLQQPNIEALAEGSTGQTELSRARLSAAIKVLLPSTKEQKAIAATLSCLDDKIELNNRINKNLEEMAQAIFKSWFIDFEPFQDGAFEDRELGRIPKGWRIGTIADCSSLVTRGISPKYADISDQYVINQKCIRNGSLNTALSRPHNNVVKEEKRLQFGDVLINSTGTGTLGRVAQVYERLNNFTVDSHVTIVRPKNTNMLCYMGCLLKNMQSKFEHAATGSTGQTELAREAINKMEMLIPSERVLEDFSKVYDSIYKKIVHRQKENLKLSFIRDTLLPKLMSGEIRVPIEEV